MKALSSGGIIMLVFRGTKGLSSQWKASFWAIFSARDIFLALFDQECYTRKPNCTAAAILDFIGWELCAAS